MSTRLVRGADGTALRAWCNDAEGEPVLICNGLGAPPDAWSQVVVRDSGFRVITWYQRGLSGSERPRDPARIRVEDHADDARAVLDAFEMRSPTVVGWSLGVNVAFELALEEPARVRAAARAVPGARLRELAGTHFLPLQYPEVMLEELRRLHRS
jgi:3-oxoadipate enol-lactonase